MNVTSLILGAVAGLVWGFCGAVLNFFIMKKGLASGNSKKLMNLLLVRMAVDVVWLGLVFIIRNSTAVNFVAAMVATAAALSMGTIFFTFKLAGSAKK